MKVVRIFLIVVGIWYVLNLLLTWPSIFGPLLPGMYPGVDLHTAEPVFRLLLEAWVIVGIQLAAIGVVALWGARKPAQYLALIPVIVMTEIVDGIWDVYSIACSYEATSMGVITLVIHGLVVAGAYWAWRAAQLDLKGPSAAR